ncbi:MAG: cytochrome P450 [Acidobacteriota bacterium]|nr:cytochrome P450 [Acidobacteriota bacterium]
MSVNPPPPGPKVSRLQGFMLATRRRDPLAFLLRLARDYGDIAHFQIGSRRIFLLNHPDYIKDALGGHYDSFSKRHGSGPSKHFLGEGLVISEGDYHRSQRRLIQPAFHRRHVAGHAALMVEHAARWRERWSHGQRVDVAREMRLLTLEIMSRLLFGVESEAEAEEIGEAVTLIFTQFRPFGMPLARLLNALPHARRVERAKSRLDAIIYRRIAERRAGARGGADLLGMLLEMEGEGGPLTDTQVRDEVLTLFLAGHESVANSLMWTWYLVSQHPDVEARLHEEVDAVLGPRLPTADDVPRLRYTEMVLAESMRLYPPSWTLARFVTGDWRVGGYILPAGSVVIMSQYTMHRHPRYFRDPSRFDPERWTPEARAARPPFTYFPFGGGPRRCIGEGLAWVEGILLIATLAQRWGMRLVADHPVVTEPVVTLRPKYGIMMELERREAARAAAPRAGNRDAGAESGGVCPHRLAMHARPGG